MLFFDPYIFFFETFLEWQLAFFFFRLGFCGGSRGGSPFLVGFPFFLLHPIFGAFF